SQHWSIKRLLRRRSRLLFSGNLRQFNSYFFAKPIGLGAAVVATLAFLPFWRFAEVLANLVVAAAAGVDEFSDHAFARHGALALGVVGDFVDEIFEKNVISLLPK